MKEEPNSKQSSRGWTSSFLKVSNSRWTILAFRWVVGLIFVVSACGKLVDLERYSVDAVYNFGIFPIWLARPFGLIIPFIELFCGLGLVLGVLTRLAALGVTLMSLSFFIAKSIVLLQGRSIECGCFGAIIDTLASTTIFMDLPVVLLAIIVMVSPCGARHWLAFTILLPRACIKRFQIIW